MHLSWLFSASSYLSFLSSEGSQATILLLPLDKSSIPDAHLAANLIDPDAGLCLLKRKGNLLVRKSAFFTAYPLIQ
jgi:hypothetical protein